MNKKLKIVLGIIAVIILILIIINIFKNNKSSEITENNEEKSDLSDIQYNKETGEYYIEDEETGEILHTADNEEELYIYTIDPDYDPKLPAEDTALMESETENIE